MALELIRKNGANVTAYDDSIMFDNALLNQNGIIDKVGNMMNAYAEGNNLIIRDGYAIIKGRQFKISGTESVTLQKPSSGNFYYLIYAQVNTEGSVESVTINATYQTNDYPTVSNGEDIVADKNGIANLPLFTVRTSSSGVEEINKIASLISSANLINATVKELKKYTDDADTNRKEYIDKEVKDLNEKVTPFLTLNKFKEITDTTTEFNLNQLFTTGAEKYLLAINPDSILSDLNNTSIRVKASASNTIYSRKLGFSGSNIVYNSGNITNFYFDGIASDNSWATTGLLLIKKTKKKSGAEFIEINSLDAPLHTSCVCENAQINQFSLLGKYILYKLV